MSIVLLLLLLFLDACATEKLVVFGQPFDFYVHVVGKIFLIYANRKPHGFEIYDKGKVLNPGLFEVNIWDGGKKCILTVRNMTLEWYRTSFGICYGTGRCSFFEMNYDYVYNSSAIKIERDKDNAIVVSIDTPFPLPVDCGTVTYNEGESYPNGPFYRDVVIRDLLLEYDKPFPCYPITMWFDGEKFGPIDGYLTLTHDEEFVLGKPFTLNCTASSKLAGTGNFSWYKDNSVFYEYNGTQIGNWRFMATIISAGWDDLGLYTCVYQSKDRSMEFNSQVIKVIDLQRATVYNDTTDKGVWIERVYPLPKCDYKNISYERQNQSFYNVQMLFEGCNDNETDCPPVIIPKRPCLIKKMPMDDSGDNDDDNSIYYYSAGGGGVLLLLLIIVAVCFKIRCWFVGDNVALTVDETERLKV